MMETGIPVTYTNRGFWLQALIVGAAILVWLTLIGGIASGIILAFAVSGSSSPGGLQTSDIYGRTCAATSVVSDGQGHRVCP